MLIVLVVSEPMICTMFWGKILTGNRIQWVLSRDKKTILILDYCYFGFRVILFSTIATAAIAVVELYHKKWAFFIIVKCRWKSTYFAILMNRAYEQLTAFCDNVSAKTWGKLSQRVSHLFIVFCNVGNWLWKGLNDFKLRIKWMGNRKHDKRFR